MQPDFGSTLSDEEIFVKKKNTSEHVKPLGFVVAWKFDFIYLAGQGLNRFTAPLPLLSSMFLLDDILKTEVSLSNVD